MALFGGYKDINTFVGISREILENVVSQNCGYYKYKLDETPVNVYGEAANKYFIGPVLIPCLIERGEWEYEDKNYSTDVKRDAVFRFMVYHLMEANVFPEAGDVIMYNENYYLVDGTNENQFILGKDPYYAYQEGLEKFGSSYSILAYTHVTSADALGIKQQRL